jgi:hypothetical protein
VLLVWFGRTVENDVRTVPLWTAIPTGQAPFTKLLLSVNAQSAISRRELPVDSVDISDLQPSSVYSVYPARMQPN